MIAHELKPFYAARAKQRQVASGGDFREKAVVEKIPQANRSAKARDEGARKEKRLV